MGERLSNFKISIHYDSDTKKSSMDAANEIKERLQKTGIEIEIKVPEDSDGSGNVLIESE